MRKNLYLLTSFAFVALFAACDNPTENTLVAPVALDECIEPGYTECDSNDPWGNGGGGDPGVPIVTSVSFHQGAGGVYGKVSVSGTGYDTGTVEVDNDGNGASCNFTNLFKTTGIICPFIGGNVCDALGPGGGSVSVRAYLIENGVTGDDYNHPNTAFPCGQI